jgi:hypothetical protein
LPKGLSELAKMKQLADPAGEKQRPHGNAGNEYDHIIHVLFSTGG